jgi:VCBS repeat-containing protein
MKNKTFKFRPISLALLLAGIGMAPASYAVDLMAVEGSWTPAGGPPITMWGFAPDTGSCPGGPVNWNVGPQLTDDPMDPDAAVVAGNLTINLRNCLSEGVSIVIPGQPATSCDGAACAPVIVADGTGRDRVRALTTEAAANGGIVTYQWTGVKNGTFLYQSGSHPAKQVQMGLYGALTVGTYPGTHDEVTLLYSEIDPALHSPPAAATPLGYHPRHYLVNGSVNPPALAAGDTNHPTVLRFLNAGLDFHVPAFNGSYMSLVAEDGNLYPFAKQQYSVSLPAGKTIDALWSPASAGSHVIYDRRGNGMVSTLTLAAGVGEPIANDDSYMTGEDMPLDVLISFDVDGITPLTGVLANDTDALLAALTVPPSSANLVSSTSSGSLTLNADGSLSYAPNANFNGTDSFTYRANDGSLDSTVATVSITVTPDNDAPVADPNGPYTATVNVAVTLDGSGSSDIDGDALTYTWDFGDMSPAGTGVMPSHTYTATGSYTVSLVVNDGTVDSAAATTTVVVDVAVNTPPVAVEDFATVQRNSVATFINLTDNDSDVDGNLKDGSGNVAPGQINITTGSLTTRGGTVTVLTNGVNYTPKKNFRGTDTFNYIVSDLDGAPSNEVTVRVNVVK